METGNPEKLTVLLELLGFSMSEFFNEDGSLKSHVELAKNADGSHRSLPYTLADYHHQLTNGFKFVPPSERFALFVQLMSGDADAAPIHRFIFNFLLAIVGSINAGEATH